MNCPMPAMAMQHAPAGKSKDGSSMSDAQACGYCGLLAHMPALPVPQARFALTVQAIVHRAATRFESVRLVARVSPSQPRAPPVLS
ncbi:MFS transporter (fragment) [Burkholderia sp. 8Y]